MSKHKKQSKNLYTLNQSYAHEVDFDSEHSDYEEPTQLNFNTQEEEIAKEEIDKLHNKIDELEKQVYKLKIKNKDLKDAVQIAEMKNNKHEEKQRELIKKLSHEQVSNKQLEYEMKKLSEEIFRNRENYKTADLKTAELNSYISKIQEEKSNFVHTFRKIADAIAYCSDSTEFSGIVAKFGDFIRKNMKQYEQAPIDREWNIEFKFEVEKVSSLKQKLSELEEKYLKLKEENESERGEKKRIIMQYTDKINKLKGHCDSLKFRVDERQRENEVEISHLRKVISEKNEIIYQLNMKVEEGKFRKESFASRKSRVKKRSYYIGDGDKDATEFKMSELENEIEELERKLVKELQQ